MYAEMLKKAPKHLLNADGISKGTISERQERLMQMRVEAYNSISGKLTGYDCPKCLNRGDYAAIVDGEEVIFPCQCMEARRAVNRITASGLKGLLNRYRFDNYDDGEPWQKKIKKAAELFAKNPDGWFYIGGTAGCGKTHICTAICSELLNREIPVIYMLWRDKVTGLKAVVNEPEYQDETEQYRKVKCLYIDDFLKAGREKVTDGDLNIAFELLNARYNQDRKITIFSSERSIEDIMGLDAAIGSRIYQNCRNNYFFVSGQEKNWRLR